MKLNINNIEYLGKKHCADSEGKMSFDRIWMYSGKNNIYYIYKTQITNRRGRDVIIWEMFCIRDTGYTATALFDQAKSFKDLLLKINTIEKIAYKVRNEIPKEL